LTLLSGSENNSINHLHVTTITVQVNVIIERVHKVVNDMLRSYDLENNHENLEAQEDNPFDYFIQSTSWAMQSTYHTTPQATPFQIVFDRDMIQNIAFIANWDSINCMATMLFQAPIIQTCRQHYVNLCLAEILSTILPSEQTGIEYKKENRTFLMSPIKEQESSSLGM
jgi:hypothetical protein